MKLLHSIVVQTKSEAMKLDHRKPGARFRCSVCGEALPVQSFGGTGYACNNRGRLICYACAWKHDAASMVKTGRAVLYFTPQRNRIHTADDCAHVTNWPGTLSFRAFNVRKGRHNIARTQTRFNFVGPDKKTWSGVQFGEWSQLAKCRRNKSK